MFGLLRNLYVYLREKSEKKLCLLLLGIDNAGKTTLLHTMQGQLDEDVAPTLGFSSADTTSRSLGLRGSNFTMQVYDLGGGKNIRRTWGAGGYYGDAHAVIYVVDAANPERFQESRDVLHQCLQAPDLYGKPLLVFANKQDLPTAASAADLAMQLGLSSLSGNPFHVLGCSAKGPSGHAPDPRIRQGLQWLHTSVNDNYSKLDQQVQVAKVAAAEQDARRKAEKAERRRQLAEAKAAAAAAAAAEEGAGASMPSDAPLPPNIPVRGDAGPPTAGVQPSANPLSALVTQHNALSTLPGGIPSPKPAHPDLASSAGGAAVPTLTTGARSPAVDESHPSRTMHVANFSDLQGSRMDQGRLAAKGSAGPGASLPHAQSRSSSQTNNLRVPATLSAVDGAPPFHDAQGPAGAAADEELARTLHAQLNHVEAGASGGRAALSTQASGASGGESRGLGKPVSLKRVNQVAPNG